MKDLHAFKKFQAEWMSSDQKPTGRTAKKIKSSARQAAKRKIRKDLKEVKDGRSK